jgi:hypothetical protein
MKPVSSSKITAEAYAEMSRESVRLSSDRVSQRAPCD